MITLNNEPENSSVGENAGDADHHIVINITRHGPKESLGGPLTSEGKKRVESHYTALYRNKNKHALAQRKLVSSPVHRAIETANIYKEISELFLNLPPIVLEKDTRLSEQGLVDFVEHLPEDKKFDWFRHWFDSAIGKQAIKEFSCWIIEQLQNHKNDSRNVQIDAFSHGPVMAGFVLHLEELTNINMLRLSRSTDDKLSLEELFNNATAPFNYLSTIQIRYNSSNPKFFDIQILEKVFSIDLQLLHCT